MLDQNHGFPRAGLPRYEQMAPGKRLRNYDPAYGKYSRPVVLSLDILFGNEARARICSSSLILVVILLKNRRPKGQRSQARNESRMVRTKCASGAVKTCL
jgi:hypothetical protein